MARINIGRREQRWQMQGQQYPNTETEENNQPPNGNETDGTAAVAPTEVMYLPDLDNSPLSQALKDGFEWGLEDKLMVECPKLKQYKGLKGVEKQRITRKNLPGED